MNFSLIRKGLFMPLGRVSATKRLAPMNAVGCGFGSQLAQVRHLGPLSGPPRYKISKGQKALYGFLPLILMMVIPTYCLLQLPRWSALHNNRPWGDDEGSADE